MVQWLRLCTSTAGGVSSILGLVGGTKIPHAAHSVAKKKLKQTSPRLIDVLKIKFKLPTRTCKVLCRVAPSLSPLLYSFSWLGVGWVIWVGRAGLLLGDPGKGCPAWGKGTQIKCFKYALEGSDSLFFFPFKQLATSHTKSEEKSRDLEPSLRMCKRFIYWKLPTHRAEDLRHPASATESPGALRI